MICPKCNDYEVPPYGVCPCGYVPASEPPIVHGLRKEIAALKVRLAEAKGENEDAKVLLRKCWSDIFQTARVNQGNLDGRELLCPNDKPCEALIGRHFVNQGGVDTSLCLREEVGDFLGEQAARDAQKET